MTSCTSKLSDYYCTMMDVDGASERLDLQLVTGSCPGNERARPLMRLLTMAMQYMRLPHNLRRLPAAHHQALKSLQKLWCHRHQDATDATAGCQQEQRPLGLQALLRWQIE